MSQAVELFNLDVGKSLAPAIRSQLEAVKIGPFSIRFVDDYDQKRQLLSEKGQFVSNLKAAGGTLEIEEYTLPSRQSSGWVCTATVNRTRMPSTLRWNPTASR